MASKGNGDEGEGSTRRRWFLYGEPWSSALTCIQQSRLGRGPESRVVSVSQCRGPVLRPVHGFARSPLFQAIHTVQYRIATFIQNSTPEDGQVKEGDLDGSQSGDPTASTLPNALSLESLSRPFHVITTAPSPKGPSKSPRTHSPALPHHRPSPYSHRSHPRSSPPYAASAPHHHLPHQSYPSAW